MLHRFKVLNTLLEMEGRPRVHHPLSTYLELAKDKNGMLKTRLKIPYWNRQEAQPPVDLSDEDICIIGSTTVGLSNGLTAAAVVAATAAAAAGTTVDHARGTADGGFTDITSATPDFTTTVIHQHMNDVVRSPADGKCDLQLRASKKPSAQGGGHVCHV